MQAGIMLHPAVDRLAVGEDCHQGLRVPARGRNPGGAGAKRSPEAGLHRNSMHPWSISAWGACFDPVLASLRSGVEHGAGLLTKWFPAAARNGNTNTKMTHTKA